MKSFHVRRGGPADADRIRRVAMETFREAFQAGLPPQALQALLDARFAADRFRSELRDPAFAYFVAEDRDGFEGYAVIHAADAPVPAAAPAFELDRIYLRSAVHGSGLGDALMEACLAEVLRREARSLWLKVWTENPRARAFYRRWGFLEQGRVLIEISGTALEHLLLVRPLVP